MSAKSSIAEEEKNILSISISSGACRLKNNDGLRPLAFMKGCSVEIVKHRQKYYFKSNMDVHKYKVKEKCCAYFSFYLSMTGNVWGGYQFYK